MDEKPANQSVNIFEQINLICKDFRRAFRRGDQPRIENQLDLVSPPAKSTLFQNLLEIEIKHRLRQNESPSSNEYIKRFPQFASQVRHAFDESTMGSIEIMHSKSTDLVSDDLQTRTFEFPAANRLGDYELIRELGRGGFGVVYEARHLKRQNLVALKTLPTGVDGQELNADRLYKFRREFRTLSEINHPNLVGMQTLEVDGEQWFFTMDLIQGEDFLSYVRPNDELDEARLRLALKQLAKGIIALHEIGIVHRDLKPSNVLVNADARLLILDFGLVAELQKVSDFTVSCSGMFAGTPKYAAPEQMFGDRSEACDWYAMGVMLYEAMTGKSPFSGTQMELLRQKQLEDLPSLAERDGLPPDLVELVDQLVKREPKQRPDAMAISSALALEFDSTTHGSVDDDEFNASIPMESDQNLIGRETQLAKLEQAKRELLEKREPVVVFINGLSGEGKSSLAEYFLRPLRLGDEILVLSGRCYDRESVPFKAVDSVIEALVSFLRSCGTEPVKSFLPKDIRLLAHIFPLLRRVESIAAISTAGTGNIGGHRIRQRSFVALRKLLTNISADTPVIIFIDDLQWGDGDSSHVLIDLISPPDPPNIMLIGSFRSDEAETSPFLQNWNRRIFDSGCQLNLHKIQLAPLSREQCIELAALRGNAELDLIRRHADRLFKDTGGNPYLVEQLIGGFVPEDGKFEQVPLKEIIGGRLRTLPTVASSLLNIIAVSGQAISFAEVAAAVDHDTPDLATLIHMRSEHLVRLIGTEDRQLVDTYHDKIRETVLQSLSEGERRQLHLQIAETIEKQEQVTGSQMLAQYETHSKDPSETHPIPARVFDLAYHFFEANDPRAFAYQLLAGEKAVNAFASQDARNHLLRAESVMPPDVLPSIKHLIWLGYGPNLSAGSGYCDPTLAKPPNTRSGRL